MNSVQWMPRYLIHHTMLSLLFHCTRVHIQRGKRYDAVSQHCHSITGGRRRAQFSIHSHILRRVQLFNCRWQWWWCIRLLFGGGGWSMFDPNGSTMHILDQQSCTDQFPRSFTTTTCWLLLWRWVCFPFSTLAVVQNDEGRHCLRTIDSFVLTKHGRQCFISRDPLFLLRWRNRGSVMVHFIDAHTAVTHVWHVTSQVPFKVEVNVDDCALKCNEFFPVAALCFCWCCCGCQVIQRCDEAKHGFGDSLRFFVFSLLPLVNFSSVFWNISPFVPIKSGSCILFIKRENNVCESNNTRHRFDTGYYSSSSILENLSLGLCL